MRGYTDSGTDLKTLVGQQTYSGYTHQEQEGELQEAAAAEGSESLSCYFCKRQITADQAVNLHHPIYKSKGGTEVEPAHESCHVEYHSRQGDFRSWGRLSAVTRAWAFNLRNVRTNPAYELDRQFYLAYYAH